MSRGARRCGPHAGERSDESPRARTCAQRGTRACECLVLQPSWRQRGTARLYRGRAPQGAICIAGDQWSSLPCGASPWARYPQRSMFGRLARLAGF